MATEKLQFVIGGENSSGVRSIKEMNAELDKLSRTSDTTAGKVNTFANRLSALTAAQNHAKGSAAELAASHKQMETAAYQAAGKVGLLNQKLADMRQAREHVRGLTSDVEALGTSFLKIGAVGVAGLGYAVKEASSLSEAMGMVSARTRASKDELDKLQATAISIGKDKRFAKLSPTDVGQGMVTLATGGLRPGDITGGAAEATAAAAVVGNVQMADAAQLVVDVMKTFNMEAARTMEAVDSIAAAASGSATDFGQLSYALKMGGSEAQRLNRPLHETIGTFALLADHMVRGSDAGTAYKTFMLNLNQTTKEAIAVRRQYRISLMDEAGNFKDMAAIAEELKTKLGGLSDAQQTMALKALFGNDAIRVASSLMKEGAAGVEHYEKMVSRAGAASESAMRQQEGLHGALQALKSTTQAAATVMGNELAPNVITVANKIEDLVGRLGESESATGKAARRAAIYSTGLALLAGVTFKASAAVVSYKAQLAILATQTEATAASQTAFNATMLKGSVALVAGGAAIDFAQTKLHSLAEENRKTGKSFDEFQAKIYDTQAGMIEWFKNPVWETAKWSFATLRMEVDLLRIALGDLGPLEPYGQAAADTAKNIGGQAASSFGSSVAGAMGTVKQMYSDAVTSAKSRGGGGGGSKLPPISDPTGGVAPKGKSSGTRPADPGKLGQRPSKQPVLPGTGQGSRSIGDYADQLQQEEDSRKQWMLDEANRSNAAMLAAAEGNVWQAQKGMDLAGKGQQGAAWREYYNAQEAYWNARETAAQKVADITGETLDLDRVRLENEKERTQLLADQVAKQQQLVEEKRRAREEAEAEAKAAKLQGASDKAELAGLKAERAKIQGASEQRQKDLAQAAQAAQLAHAAELARQGKTLEAERIKNDVLRQQADKADHGQNLQQAVIGGDLGRIQDILQAAHGYGNGLSGMQGDPVSDAVRNGRDRSPRIISDAVGERLERNAMETARMIRSS